jgi:predicted Rossmann fold flavoprotein
MKDIIIIWAWPAGLMALASIIENWWANEFRIQMFEKNKSPGKKLLISGWGRCNITTSIDDMESLSTKYVRGWDFIQSSIQRFSPKNCREWFESQGLPLKIQNDKRVFPESDNGKDVLWVFEKLFAKFRNRISIHYGEWVLSVSKNQNDFRVITEHGEYRSDILVIATWWNAYSHTGSSGDGYAFARSLGHTITRLWPSLSSFLTTESWLHELSGIAFEDARINTPQWPLLLTHFGISGPLAFMVSAELAWEEIGNGKNVALKMAPIATLWTKEWDQFLRQSFEVSPKKTISTVLSEKLPKRFCDAFVRHYFDQFKDTYVGSLSKKTREHLSLLLWEGLPITLLERRPWDEFVTAGWVDTDEIDPKTMESKIHKNLYFAGEILNVDGYTGGFSLQICWSSGYAVGKSII